MVSVTCSFEIAVGVTHSLMKLMQLFLFIKLGLIFSGYEPKKFPLIPKRKKAYV